MIDLQLGALSDAKKEVCEQKVRDLSDAEQAEIILKYALRARDAWVAQRNKKLNGATLAIAASKKKAVGIFDNV